MRTSNLFDWKKRVVKIFHSTCVFLFATIIFPCQTAWAQGSSATLTLTPNFANNTVTVNVSGTYADGDTLFYTFNGESPSFSDSYVLLANPVIPVGTVGTTLTVSLGQRTDETESWSSDATQLDLARYAAPEVSYNYANDSFSVDNVSQLVNETTETLTLFLNGDATTDSTFAIGSSYGSTAITYYSTYSLHLDGNNLFPSLTTPASTNRYHLPVAMNFRPRTITGAGTPSTGQFASNSGTAFYVNYSHFADNDLVDPSPYDANTYDEVWSSSTSFSIPQSVFKVVAGPQGGTNTQALSPNTGSLFPSPAVLIDTTYSDKVILYYQHEGTNNYLHVANGSLENTHTFDYSCLWSRDATHNYYYQRVNGTNYYLYYYQGELMLTSSSTNATSWSLSDHRLERSDNHTQALAFNPANSRWIVVQNGNTDVAYHAKHTLHHSGTYYDLAGCLSDPISINNENVDHAPNWVAMKEGTTRSFSTRPRVSLNIYTLPRHERYALAVDGGATSPEFYYYEGISYSQISDIPSRSESKNILDSRDFVTGQNSTDERLSVEWHVVNAEGEEVTDAPFTLSASSSNNTFLSTLTRTSSLSAPATYYLQATIDYQLDGHRNYNIPIHATALSNRLPIIAEQTTTQASCVGNGEDATSFVSGRYYLLRTPDPDNGTAAYLSVDANGNAALTLNPEAARLYQVSQLSNGYYTLVNAALTHGNNDSPAYLTSNSQLSTYNYKYHPDLVAATITSADAGDGSNQFQLTHYANGEGNATYFTITPRSVLEASPAPYSTSMSLIPAEGAITQGNTLRLQPYDISRIIDYNNNILRSDLQHYYAQRWQLVDAQLLPPTITMNAVGRTTITDLEGHQQGLYGTLHYRVRESENDEWGAVQSVTLNETTYSVVLENLNEHNQVEAWKSADNAHSYLASSDITSFTVRKMASPVISVNDNELIITATADTDAPQATIYYTNVYNELDDEPADTSAAGSSTYLRYDSPITTYDHLTFTARAYAPNWLVSDPVQYDYFPLLQLGTDGGVRTDGYIALVAYFGTPSQEQYNYAVCNGAEPMSYVNSVPSTDQYIIRYTTDGTEPDENSTLLTTTMEATAYCTDYPNTPYVLIPGAVIHAIKAKAFPSENSHYRPSPTLTLLPGAQYLTITYIENNPNLSQGADTNIMCHTTTGSHQEVINSTNTNTTDNSFLWMSGTQGAARHIRNANTNKYLALTVTTVNGTETRTLTAAENYIERVNDNNIQTSTRWIWTGEAASSANEAGFYELYSTLGITEGTPTRYYLTFDLTNHAWTAMTQDEIASGNAQTPGRYQTQVAFRTRLVDYQGGNEFQALSADLYALQGDEWVTLSDQEHTGWAALSPGKQLQLRAALNGDLIHYSPNTDINIIRTGYDNGEDPFDADRYQPWQQWHSFYDQQMGVERYVNHFTQVPGYSVTPEHGVFDEHTVVQWQNADGQDLSDGGSLGNLFTVVSISGDRITLQRTNTVNVSLPDFGSLVKADSWYNTAYANSGILHFDNSVRLIAEGTASHPDYTADQRTRIVSHDNQYLSVLPNQTASINSTDYPYLVGQPQVKAQPDYTDQSVWLVSKVNDSPLSRYTISSDANNHRRLCHLPGNDYTAFGDIHNAVYVYDTTSPEAFNYNLTHNNPLLSHNEDYLHFDITQYTATENNYVVLSPYYKVASANLATHLGLANYDNEHLWMQAYMGSVTKGDEELTLSQAAFWSARWQMEEAWLTPPDVDMTPNGVVTLSHHLQATAEANSTDLYFYYTLGSDMPTFTGTTPDGDGLAPTANLAPAEGTLLYDPQNKPVLTENQQINVVAVLMQTLAASDSYTVNPHISQPFSFVAVKSLNPWWADDDNTVVSFDREGGDTLVVSRGLGEPNYDSTSIGYTHYAATNQYTLTNWDNESYAIRAYQHNKLQSDVLLRIHNTALVATIASATITENLGSIQLRIGTQNNQHPLSNYYKVYYYIGDNEPSTLSGWTVIDPSAESTVAFDEQSHEALFTIGNIDLSNGPQRITIQALPNDPNPETRFYSPSNVASRYLIPTLGPNTPLASGDGSSSNPYLIQNEYDLLVLASNHTYWTGGNHFKVTAPIALASDNADLFTSIGSSTQKFDGHWDGAYQILSNLKQPLFGVCSNAHIYNVMVDESEIVSNSNTHVGGIVCTAEGETRIYNSGLLNSEKERTTSVTSNANQSTGTAAGIVGLLKGSSRVVNCYNFARIVGNNTNSAAGIVGIVNANDYSTKTAPKSIVFNCINYGKLEASGNKSNYPVIGYYDNINNGNSQYNFVVNNLNQYNYYLADETLYDLTKLVGNGAFGAEEYFLNRYEMYRYVMNINHDRCGWWVNAPSGSIASNTADYYTDLIAADNNHIGKWVLNTSIAPYPIVQPRYEVSTVGEGESATTSYNPISYPSVINPGYADASTEAPAYEGKRLGTLAVTLSVGDHGSSTFTTHPNAPVDIPITDMDTLHHDFNYRKIQLPYFQDYFRDADNKWKTIVTEENVDWVVTGWKITSVTAGGQTYTTGVCPAHYDYADRNDVQKDIYADDNRRVFAQGGFYNVPYDVTAITLTAYWGTAYYLCEEKNDSYYNGNNTLADNPMYGAAGKKAFGVTKTTTQPNNRTSVRNLINTIPADNTVYDAALVLLSDCHITNTNTGSNNENSLCTGSQRAFTVMSLDEDNDHEPDHVLYHYFNGRQGFNPIRFDNIVYADFSMAGMTNKFAQHLGIVCPIGHFEITETALARFYQFEYDNRGNHQYTTKEKAPFILNSGVIEQLLSAQNVVNDSLFDKTLYFQLGGHLYLPFFGQGCNPNQGNTKQTYRCPVVVTGGEYDNFYLSGYLMSLANTDTATARLFACGGRFHHYASGGYEEIRGDIAVQVDHIIADEFYGGGINATYPVGGNISVQIDNSIVWKTFAGGPKFGDMASGKTVTTTATNTYFGEYYGAGIGGTALDRVNKLDKNYQEDVLSYSPPYTKGQYVNNLGVLIDYDFEFMPWSNSAQHLRRFYFRHAKLSTAKTHTVSSTLTGCTVNNNYYGGGFVGSVEGTATSVLDSCTINGSVFAGGNSGTAPKARVYDMVSSSDLPTYISGVYINTNKNLKATSEEYTWTNDPSIRSGNKYINEDSHLIYSATSLSDLGRCASTNLTIKGTTLVHGSVYGGGNEAVTGAVASTSSTNTTQVLVEGNSHVERDVFGGGKQGMVYGSSTVVVGARPDANEANDNATLHRPWIEGDIYGGGDTADVRGNTSVTLYEGMTGPVYGGGCTGSVLAGNSAVTLLGGYVGYHPSEEEGVIHYDAPQPRTDEGLMYYGVFGGGYGLGTTIDGASSVTIGSDESMNGDVHVYGSVYGGGEAGQVGGGYKTDAAGSFVYNSDTRTYSAPTETSTEDIHYSYISPDWTRDYVSTVNVLSDNINTVHIAGAVFGGSRGYAVSEQLDLNENTEHSHLSPIAGAVYGNTQVNIGTLNGTVATDKIQIGSIDYYTSYADASKYGLLKSDISLYSGAILYEQGLYVYDVDNLCYRQVTPRSELTIVNALTPNNGSKAINISSPYMDEDAIYFLNTGRVAVAGGGECGPVYGNKIFNSNHILQESASRFGSTKGNTEVNIYYGTIGDVQHEEVNGCVYGGGLSAKVDGTATVTTNGANAWIRGDIYGGGCMGEVLAYNRSSATDEAMATSNQFVKGWARNVHGGSNLTDHNTGCKSLLTVGATGQDNQLTLVSESAYGANGFSPSKSSSQVIIESGMIGFVHPGEAINHLGDEMEGTENVVLNQQPGLSYEGAVYGGGFGPQAWVTNTEVTVNNGVIRNGVFGGGELAPVGELSTDESGSIFTYHGFNSDRTPNDIVYHYITSPTPRTQVTINGGQMSMVLGGGRGYTGFMDVVCTTPGTILGSTQVTIAGGTINSENYDSDLGAGNVYGGGLEGVVTENTNVVLNGGTIQGHAFAGGRGYNQAMTGIYAETKENASITNRASADAGDVYGNTHLTVNGQSIVECGVYGGGEGLIYKNSANNQTNTVATVHGNALVEITGGTLGGGYTFGTLDNKGSYAGGRVANVNGTADIYVSGTANVAAVYGGNDISGSVLGRTRTLTTQSGASLGDTSTTYVSITGTPKVGRVFGGGNGDYRDELYNNPNLAHLNLSSPTQPATYVDINITSTTYTNDQPTGYVGAAFGGGNQASVDSALVVLHGKGLVDTLFAGGNGATVAKSATVRALANTVDIVSSEPGYNVGQLFGGNNQAEMAILPNLDLRSGVFNRIFGGGNAGAMTGLHPLTDIKGQEITGLSTYVLVNSQLVTVRNGLFGGCNQADVRGGTYVDVRKTSSDNGSDDATSYGIYRLFGGNDISREVHNSRIDVNGGTIHNIFGGSNGYYLYEPADGGTYNAYDYAENGSRGELVAYYTSQAPAVDSTQVNIWGGNIRSNIYGGGYAGDCRVTHVVVDDRTEEANADDPTPNTNASPARRLTESESGWGNAEIHGKIFGGGCGIFDNITNGTPHVGNVTENAITDLYSVTTLNDAYAYGGGNAGDVENTLITVHPDWNQPLIALYAGCYGSDVKGSARAIMNCMAPESGYNVERLFGGNDYTGNVHHSELTVNDGKYLMVYGAGNGNYYTVNPDGTYASGPHAEVLRVPNSEEPVVNFYNGTVVQNLYGGGNLGSCYRLDNDGATFHTGNGSNGYSNIEDYSLVTVNMHGGTIMNDIFAGAASINGMDALIYGLKQLNMDGGTVRNSVYGGTESVNDGYSAECTGNSLDAQGHPTATTLRPSSILNLVGGTVNNNVYGAGYLGNVYGSVYINVGKEAVEQSMAYNRTYGSNHHDYSQYKPHFVNSDEANTGANLKPSPLYLEASIYNGANWGEAGTSTVFNTQGFYGGESRLLVDGEGYYTSNAATATDLPAMDIHYSLIGAGTSCEGGDLMRDITVRNYGLWNDCTPSKDLWSIQRADKVTLFNVGLNLTGDQDAYSAYPTSRYAMNRCDTIVMVDHNVVQIDKPIVRAKKLAFVDADGNVITNSNDAMTSLIDGNCADASDECSLRNTTAVSSVPYSTIIVNNGSYIDVYTSDQEVVYGEVQGYAFLRAESQTQAIVTARPKTESVNTNDGGFYSVCPDENTLDDEFNYENGTNYRAWKFGHGHRSRQVTIVAHSDTTALAENRGFDVTVTNDGTTELKRLAVAKVTLELPPASAGHYYAIEGGITVDQENRELQLAEGAFKPDDYNNDNLTGVWYNAGEGHIITDPTNVVNSITSDPAHTFGLLITQGENFGPNCSSQHTNCNTTVAISSSTWFDEHSSFYTHQVATEANSAIPTIDIYLTYDPTFPSTLMGDVSFTLREYTDNDTPAEDIEVTISISTIITAFKDQTYDLVAMQNGFDNHVYSRKLILPASMHRRSLYLSGYTWQPLDNNGSYDDGLRPSIGNFYLMSNRTDHDQLNENQFAITVEPTEDLSSTMTTTLGWYTIDANTIDVYSLGYPNGSNGQSMSPTMTDNNTASLKTSDQPKGLPIGVLDGRSSAAIDISLIFNDEILFLTGYRGQVKLYFEYYDQNTSNSVATEDDDEAGSFVLTLNVRTREKGDTIYLASAESITRGEVTLYPYEKAPAGWHGHDEPGRNNDPNFEGKIPEQYVQTFYEALGRIYDAGDVICILDQVVVDGNKSVSVHGSAWNYIPVVRYAGNNYQFPGDTCAYRGPLVVVKDNGRFASDHIVFDGSMVSKRKTLTNTPPQDGLPPEDYRHFTQGYTYRDLGWVNDTLAAAAPLFEVTDNGTLTLGNNTTLQNNYNAATTGDLMGAGVLIHSSANSATPSNPKLVLNDNVTLTNLLVAAEASGAIHLEDGVMELGSAQEGTHLSITDNYAAVGAFWNSDMSEIVIPDSWNKANVYLQRTGTDETSDTKSKAISVTNPVSPDSRIGISKYFPGPSSRDTILVAFAPNSRQQYVQNAFTNEVFSNDNRLDYYTHTDLFYNSTISPYNLYFHRCATFNKQVANQILYAAQEDGESDILQQAVLQYRMNTLSACPDGTDSVVFSVHGGFLPYTYAWSLADEPYREYTTPFSYSEVASDPTHSLAIASNSDTANLYGMTLGSGNETFNYSVTATDLAGCPLTKHFQVNMTRSTEPVGLTLNNDWTDTLTSLTNSASRNYKGLHLTAQVYPDNFGRVTGSFNGTTICDTEEEESTALLCPGDAVELNAIGADGHRFIQWSFDPYDNPNTTFVMPYTSDDVTVYAYFSPNRYWKQQVTSQPSTFTTQYNGNVEIKDEAGLAWLISTCNGLNDQQIHDYFFDTVYIRNASNGGKDDYDMSSYLWSPLGNLQHPFKGMLQVDPDVTIQGIIINEPHMTHVGFFGYLDSATVDNLHISHSLFLGNQFVGGLVAESSNSTITNSQVSDQGAEDAFSLSDNVTMITTNYISGGLVGKSSNDNISGGQVGVRLMGASTYSGGVAGYVVNSTITNTSVCTRPRTSSLYFGGAIGYSEGSTSQSQPGSKGLGSRIENNYIYLDYQGGSPIRSGGLVGYAHNSLLANNYVFGKNNRANTSATLAATLADGVRVENCYYAHDLGNEVVGHSASGNNLIGIASFSGSGNRVIVSDSQHGVDNLTRLLNLYVRDHSEGNLLHWQSDMTGVNNGYPHFGQPDMVPVFDTLSLATCDSYLMDDQLLTTSGTYYYHIVDSNEYVDTVVTLYLTLNYGTHTLLQDSIAQGEDYDNYGFHLSATQLDLLRQSLQQEGTVTVEVSDTLATINGCDSIVTLYLTLSHHDTPTPGSQLDIKVYPNPTPDKVNVEGDESMIAAELFDGVSRQLATATATGGRCSFDLTPYPSGAYYLRIRTTQGYVIKKIIKR